MKKLKSLSAILLLLAALVLTLAACDEATCQHRDEDDNSLCDKCGEAYTDGMRPSKSTLTSKTLTQNGSNLDARFANNVTTFNFLEDITVTNDGTWILSADADGADSLTAKAVDLAEGENIFYIHLTHPDQSVTTYTVNIYRNHMYTVTFNSNGGTDVQSQSVEEGYLANEPIAPTKACYTFVGWDYDFTTPVTANITVKARFTILPEMENFEFTSNSTSCTINGIKDKAVTQINIPDCVTTIGSSAFKNCDSLVGVTIPDSVTTIGSNAFYGCDSLKAVYITDIAAWFGISFDDYAANPLFYAHNLYLNGELVTDLAIPDSVTAVGDYAFVWCNSLDSVTIPDSVTTIGHSAFYYCTGLESVVIGNSVTTIGNEAFADCHSLANATIGNGVTTIGIFAFYNCDSLVSVTIPDSVTTIGNSAFYYCTSLESVAIGNSVTSIGDEAFCGCDSLVSIVIPDSVTTIGERAFYYCLSLVSITIPDSVTSIGNYAFEDCYNLKAVYITDIAAWCGISFGNPYANPLYYAHNLYLNGELVTDLAIPDSVTSIGSYAFRDCDSLVSVTIPDSVTTIGYSAFYYCTSLESVVIGNGVTTIGDYAFYSCNSLANVTIGNGVTTIGIFAFYNCDSLESVVIGNSVTSIGDEAFYDCNSLESVVIGNSVTTIGSSAFYNCNNLVSVTIGNSVTSIGDYAFFDCNSLESVVIPDSVTTIGERAFYNCDSLVSIKYRGTESQWSSISKGSGWNHNTGSYSITYNYTEE